MNIELFELACQAAILVPPKNSVGTLSEHRLHSAIKYYVQPDMEFHEVRVNGFICDAVREDGEVLEIQTGSFYPLRKKLERLLPSRPVTVIYPVVTEKRLLVTYEESGECSIRKSPKKATIYNAFAELYRIRDFLSNENFHFRIISVTCDDHRLYLGTKEAKKPFQKPVKTERIPVSLVGDVSFRSMKELRSVLPSDLPENFDSKILSDMAKIPADLARITLRVITELGITEQVCVVNKRKVYRFRDENRE
jgi:hypothetical protein